MQEKLVWPSSYINKIICGDCLEVMKGIPDKSVDVVVTDPVWPNALAVLHGSQNPFELFSAACKEIYRITDRLVVHMGCSSDPRFLDAVPKEMKFLRVCWLRINFPSYRGRILIGSDVAYAFGNAPKSRKGNHLLSGECSSKDVDMNIHVSRKNHPCGRKITHTDWLINVFSNPGETVLDCFTGSGTTNVSCKKFGRNFIGIEINQKYCEIAERRLSQDYLFT